MLEMMLAVALLTGLMTAVSAWLSVAASTAIELEGPSRWEPAARAVLKLMEDDLAVRDASLDTPEARGIGGDRDTADLEIIGDTLRIKTRHRLGDAAGPVSEHLFRLSFDGTLSVTQRTADGRSQERLLVGDVAAFTLAPVIVGGEGRAGRMTSVIVTLVATDAAGGSVVSTVLEPTP